MTSVGAPSVFRRTILFLLAPIFVLAAASMAANAYATRAFQSRMEAAYAEVLEMVSDRVDTLFAELYDSVDMLLGHPDMRRLLVNVQSPRPGEEAVRLTSVTETLGRFRASREAVDFVYLYQPSEGRVIGNGGAQETPGFFRRRYGSNSRMGATLRPETENQRAPLGAFSRIVVHRPDSLGRDRQVISLIRNRFATMTSPNSFVIDVDARHLEATLSRHLLTQNSIILVSDAEGTPLVWSANGKPADGSVGSDLAELVPHSSSKAVRIHLNNEEYLAVSRESSGSAGKLRYLVLVPSRDVSKLFVGVRLIYFVALAFGVFVAGVLSVWLSDRLHRPLRDLAVLLGGNREAGDRDEVGFINRRISEILRRNRSLEHSLSSALPLAQEQQLLRLLTGRQHVPDPDLADALANAQSKPWFCVVAITVSSESVSSRQLSLEEHHELSSNLRRLAKFTFQELGDVRICSMTDLKICVVVSADQDVHSAVSSTAQALIDGGRGDGLRLLVGVGRSYRGLEGLHSSFGEAEWALSGILAPFESTVRVYDDRTIGASYSYPLEMEERIINLAIAGKVDELDETVTRLFEQNAARRVAKEDLNELILHLNGTAHRALERLELSADALLAESPGTVQGTVPGTGAHLSDRQNYVRRFLGAIARTARAARARPRLDRIIEYVSEHYDEDLYLEGLADRFGVSYRYLSRTLRVKLGMPFHRYLSLLRIRRATELLTTTSVRVKDVASCVGFQSDKTFFRTFKSIQGVTPSEMRRMHGHEANRREVSEDYRAQVASPDYSVRIHASNGT